MDAGHTVIGLTRSDAGARALQAAGAEVHRGDLDDLASLRAGAAPADGVIHTAFNHDFSNFMANCEADRAVIEALGSVLAGSDRPLIITSGTGIANTVPNEPARENNPVMMAADMPRAASEEAAAAVAARGVNVSVVRLPQVHDPLKQGLITELVRIAREKGFSAYAGEGRNRWPAVHRSDAIRLYRLALEKREAGAKYHAVAEEGVLLRDIADSIGRALNVPARSVSAAEAVTHFGWMGRFAGHDMPASSALTQQWLNWHPTGPNLLADLEQKQFA